MTKIAGRVQAGKVGKGQDRKPVGKGADYSGAAKGKTKKGRKGGLKGGLGGFPPRFGSKAD